MVEINFSNGCGVSQSVRPPRRRVFLGISTTPRSISCIAGKVTRSGQESKSKHKQQTQPRCADLFFHQKIFLLFSLVIY